MKKIILLLMFIVPMNALAQKFGHIRSMEIIASMPEYVKAQADIQTLKKQYDDEMNRTQNDLTKKFTEYQQEQANLPKNIQERRQKELQELNEKGIQFQQDAKKLLEKAYQDMLQPIRKKMDEAIKAVGESGGFLYIFDLDRTEIPFVGADSFDVTAEVKAQLGLQ